MSYVIANTAIKNQKLYSFDSLSNCEDVTWDLCEIDDIQYDIEGSIILNISIFQQLQSKNIAVFDTKKEAKVGFKKLGIPNCRYVKLILDFTHEYKLQKLMSDA